MKILKIARKPRKKPSKEFSPKCLHYTHINICFVFRNVCVCVSFCFDFIPKPKILSIIIAILKTRTVFHFFTFFSFSSSYLALDGNVLFVKKSRRQSRNIEFSALRVLFRKPSFPYPSILTFTNISLNELTHSFVEILTITIIIIIIINIIVIITYTRLLVVFPR